jgi:hypothetical protein
MKPQLESNDPSWRKGFRFKEVGQTAALRTVGGIVPGRVHLIYMAVKGWCDILELGGLAIDSTGTRSIAGQCLKVVKNADWVVQTTFRSVTDFVDQRISLDPISQIDIHFVRKSK